MEKIDRTSNDGWFHMLAILMLFALVLAVFIACSPRVSTADISDKAPRELPKAGFSIEYTHTGFGYLEGHGFDTHVYHATTLPSGRIEEVIQYEKSDSGARETARYFIRQAGNDFVITKHSVMTKNSESTKAEPIIKATLAIQESGQRISGLFGATLESSKDGGLRFVSTSNSYMGEYFVLAEHSTRISRIRETGYRDILGSYRMPQGSDPGLYVERIDGDDQGAEDMTIRFRATDGGEYSFEAESVVPLYRVVMSGFKESLGGNEGLINTAILDTVLDHDRNFRPVLPLLIQGF